MMTMKEFEAFQNIKKVDPLKKKKFGINIAKW